MKKMSVLMIHNRNQRTAWGRRLAALCLCYFTGDEEEGGVGSQREGLSAVSSLTLPLDSRMALCLCRFHTMFSGIFIHARPLAKTDQLTSSNLLRWCSISLTKSTMWDPVMGLFSYISSPFSPWFNTAQCSLILSNSCLAPALQSLGTLFIISCSTAEVRIVSASAVDSLLVSSFSSGLAVSTGLGVVNFT